MRYSIQRVLKPPPKKIELGSLDQLKTLESFESAKKHRVYIHKEECVDFLMDRTTGKIDAPIKLLSINSVDYLLRPGLNEVPGPVYDFIVENTELQAAAQAAIQPENIKRIRPLHV